jgi:NTP pyrophosphatase (non-canonical NTP hydrolase)
MVYIDCRNHILCRNDRGVVCMIHKIAKRNGIQTIKEKLLEELHEAIEAVESNDEIDILEELADVSIMTEQYLITKHNSFEFDEMKKYKIERTIERLGIE